uniref:Uncharacterized protein n=1 Tax=Octopus bimaculoides TaxID=37653 RepID=A0A0L8GTY3_OCTBM
MAVVGDDTGLHSVSSVFSQLVTQNSGQWINLRPYGWWFHHPRTVHYLQLASHLCILLFLCTVPVSLANDMDRTAYINIQMPYDSAAQPHRSFESPKNDYDDNNSNNNNNPSYAITTTVAATTTTTANNNNNSNNKNNVSNNNNNNNSIRNSRSKSSIRRQLRRQQSSNEVSKSTHPGYTIRVEGTYSEAGNVKATQGTLYRVSCIV